MCVHAHAHSFVVCLRLAFVWSCVSLRLFYSVSSFCLPSVGTAGVCHCPAHSSFLLQQSWAACWSSVCETDAMKSLARFLILDGFCCFGSLISRLNPRSFSRDRGVHCLESHLETMARLHLSLLLVQHCVLRHLFFGFVFRFPSCRWNLKQFVLKQSHAALRWEVKELLRVLQCSGSGVCVQNGAAP